MEAGICSMTKTEIKKLVKTCIETLAKVKDIDLSIFDIRDDETLGALVFDIKLETTFGAVFGTKLCIDNTALKYLLTEDYEGKAELGKSIISKIWHDIRDYVNDDPIDSQMRRMGMNKINIPGFNGIGGVYRQSNIPTPQIKDNGDGTYKPVKRNEPIYIDPNTAYARTDIDMTLEGYRRQQILKQSRDDILANSKGQPKEDW